MSKIILIVCALAVLATVTALDFSHAADLEFELETCKSSDDIHIVDALCRYTAVCLPM